MLSPNLIIGHLSTINSTITSAVPETKLHNHIRLPLSILYSTNLLEDANALVSSGGRHSTEVSSLLHKLKTRISSLLQSKTAQARWSGVCLVKAGIETSVTFLQGAGTWIPMLLKMVNRPEAGSPITERAVSVLTRIFVITTSKPALTRELTSPHLPTFTQHLLSPALVAPDNLLFTLQSIAQILKTHPTTFRPQEKKTLDLVRSILFAEDNRFYPQEIVRVAITVYVSLVRCSQPKTQGEEWVKLFKETVNVTEQTCDVLFESLIEEKDMDKAAYQNRKISTNGTAHLLSPERIGVQRACTLLDTLHAFLSLPNAFTPPPSIPISPLLNLLDRIFAVNPNTKPHPSASPQTYHLILAAYPNVLISALSLVTTMADRLSSYSPSMPLHFLHSTTFVFTTSSKCHRKLRSHCYTTASHLISLVGRVLSLKDLQPLHELVSTACDDIVPPPPPVIITKEPVSTPNSMLLTQPTSTPSGSTSTYKKRKAPQPQNKANTAAASTIHADSFLKPSMASSAAPLSKNEDVVLVKAAEGVLTNVLLSTSSTSIPSELRSKIERTLVLSSNIKGVLSAVLYPSTKKRGGSLLPHLMALSSREVIPNISNETSDLTKIAVESLVYPRMQAIKPSGSDERDSSISGNGGLSALGSPEEVRFGGSPRGMDFLMAGTGGPPIPGEISSVFNSGPQESDIVMGSATLAEETTEEADDGYPAPPPPPVPQHAKLPASPGKGKTPTIPPAQPSAMSPPSNVPRNGSSTNGINGGNDRMFMPMPSPGRGIHAVLPPSPLRHSISIVETEDDDEAEPEVSPVDDVKGRAEKRLKANDGTAANVEKSERQPRDVDKGKEVPAEQQDDDSDVDIPEIVMGDSDDED